MMKSLAATAVLVLALGACTAQPEAGSQEVASLPTSGSGVATSVAEEERPRERLDMTPEDVEALSAPYQRCLSERGLDKKDDAKLPKEVMDEAHRACASKKPLPPWEKDATNPESADFAHRVVECLRGKGVRYVEVWADPGSEVVGVAYGGPNNDQESITLGLELTKDCEIAASKK